MQHGAVQVPIAKVHGDEFGELVGREEEIQARSQFLSRLIVQCQAPEFVVDGHVD
jgi:hypothetical protein